MDHSDLNKSPGRINEVHPSNVSIPFELGGYASERQLLGGKAEAELAAVVELVDLPAHTVLYRRGSDAAFMYEIVSGAVKTYQLFADGTHCVSAFLFPRDVVGLSERGRYVGTAETLNAVRAYRIPIDRLTQLLSLHSLLSVGLLLQVSNGLKDAQHHAIAMSRNAAHCRIAIFLLWLDDALRTRDTPPVVLLVPMTRQDIADYLGLSVESVSRALLLLEIKGALLRNGPRNIEILDRRKLLILSGIQ